ncbi:MAG: UvrD-helicase domain-containing protein [Acidimicrobiia bacterium]|nr:UvrD-helicase domain-containing protein [Acidimicrobiia bacterium]
MSTATPFDPIGVLPEGRVVLEASAGTGKTWTIAALVTRYVAEMGVPIEELLVVTFTRAATSELRSRVWNRLAEAERFLLAPGPTDDPVLKLLADTDQATRDLRRMRLRQALRNFDGATIATIHGFATRVLRGLGFLSGSDASAEPMADLSELIKQIVSDTIVGRFADAEEPRPTAKQLTEIIGTIETNHDIALVPAGGQAEGLAALRSELAASMRSDLVQRTQAGGTLTYDDLLIFARNALTSPTVGEAARELLRRQYRIALIDEFQDTDPIQWDIFNTLFDADGSTLVVIGDPKQSIYSFRGADVHAYLEAVQRVDTPTTLVTNWRSDSPLLDALDHLLTGATFGDERIAYRRVHAAAQHLQPRIEGISAPLEIRMIGLDAPIPKIKKGLPAVPPTREFIAADAAAQISALLQGTARISDDDGPRPVLPGDIAVLCRTRYEVDHVKTALLELGVPAVVGRTGSVFQSSAAEDWLILLQALEDPANASRARRASVTSFIGWTVADLAGAEDDQLLDLQQQLAGWRDVLRSKGIPTLLAAVGRSTDLIPRVLQTEGGQRTITDIHHLAEVLHEATLRNGAQSLSAWLAQEIAEAEEKPEDSETRTRRLETDADAVQILTIHAAKGLEFPVVYCPYLWGSPPRGMPIPVFHDPVTGERTADVGGKCNWDDFDTHQQLAEAERAGEEFRLLYVALTRARHHLVVWWAPVDGVGKRPLSKLLFNRSPDDYSIDLAADATLLTDERMAGKLEPLLRRAGATVKPVRVTALQQVDRYRPSGGKSLELVAAEFGRSIDYMWRRTSFSGITAGVPHIFAGDVDVVLKDDEPDDIDGGSDEGSPLLMDSLPGGMRFGTMVHQIFEHVDFAAADLPGELAAEVESALRWYPEPIDPAVLANSLEAAIQTPLSEEAGGLRLRQIIRGDRLDELGFEMPIRSSATSRVSVGDLARLWREFVPADDPLTEYADRLEVLPASAFHGFLSGSIDLTYRAATPEGDERFVIIDYKTNRLPMRGNTATVLDYAPEHLLEVMFNSNYLLQSLLYQVALHRYLRWRQPDYDPANHLGGSKYLFVRGMVGPDTPAVGDGRCGVFSWNPAPELIEAVSQLFEGERP